MIDRFEQSLLARLKQRHRQAGLKAAVTKGKEELLRAGAAAAWTKSHGKDDASNPWSRQNYPGSAAWVTQFRK